MPQEIRVVKCFDCQMYQTDMVKKSNKWSCKVCGIKQSTRTEYLRGSAVECRLKVQELNKQQVLYGQQKENETLNALLKTDIESLPAYVEESIPEKRSNVVLKTSSKWCKSIEATSQKESSATDTRKYHNNTTNIESLPIFVKKSTSEKSTNVTLKTSSKWSKCIEATSQKESSETDTRKYHDNTTNALFNFTNSGKWSTHKFCETVSAESKCKRPHTTDHYNEVSIRSTKISKWDAFT